jgi:excisionase family DNA binding protein
MYLHPNKGWKPKRNVREAAEYLGLSKSTLDKLRVTGSGPIYIKLGSRVLYEEHDLDEYAAARRRASTSAPAKEAA